MALMFLAAEFVPSQSTISTVQQDGEALTKAIVVYIKNYFDVLTKTRHHVFYRTDQTENIVVSPSDNDNDIARVIFTSDIKFQESLLHLLEQLNKDTTVVAQFTGAKRGKWRLSFDTWSKDDYYQDEEASFQKVMKRSDSVDYEWNKKELWRYDSFDARVSGQNAYAVECKPDSLSMKGQSLTNFLQVSH